MAQRGPSNELNLSARRCFMINFTAIYYVSSKQTFSEKGQTVNILGMVGYMLHVVAQLCHYGVKADTNNV